MKTFRLIAAGLFFAAIFAVSTFAQTQTQTALGKVGLINTLAFDTDKGGINKYVTAMNGLEAEFKPDGDALTALATKIQNLEKELATIKSQLEGTAPVDKTALQTSYNTKADEYGKLDREFKFKQDDAKARFERRRQVVMGPIMSDIYKALSEFAKAKGYSMILDGSKLEEAGVLIAIGDDKIDITKDFITFYNARPATTATTTTPTK
ncbi:MAG TPA: OmpH family outer membrane protein [Pyrinomonadaceae bacterium]|jgi:Skp family chaperone for outer membrane proteins